MKRARKLLPSPAMAVALVSLFISLGGGALVIAKGKQQAVPKNSVGPAQLKTGAVTPPDIAKDAIDESKIAQNAVTSNKIKDGTVERQDLPNQVISSAKIAKLPGAGAEEVNGTTVGLSGVVLEYDIELFDFTGDMYNNVADPAKMVAPRDGIYQVTVSVLWQAEAGTRTLNLVEQQANPVCTCEADADTRPASASSPTSQSLTSMIEMDAGDKVFATADSTGDDGSTDIITTRRTRMTMAWVGPAK